MTLDPLRFHFLKTLQQSERAKLVARALFISEASYDRASGTIITVTSVILTIFTKPLWLKCLEAFFSPGEVPVAKWVAVAALFVAYYFIVVNVFVRALVWLKWRRSVR